MSSYDVVLALHIMCVLGAFFLSGGLHVSEYLMKGAGTVAEVRRLTRTGRFAPLFAPLVIGIFGFGLALLHIGEGKAYHAKDAWIATAMVVLLVLFLDGPLVLARYGKKLEAAVAATPDGPVTDELRAAVREPVPWAISHANTFAALSVILLMTTKPSAAYSVTVVVVGTAIGAALGLALSRR
ncbi:MAG: hypothetical protein JWO22_3637 [Frankiales bacterium]|nr:hypothetical protein [Frankiales bacterium]